MLQRPVKNPISSVVIAVIALADLLVHFTAAKQSPAGSFLLVLLVFLAGNIVLRKTLLRWYPDLTVAITLGILAFGTNLFQVVSLDYQLQPVLLFTLYAMLVFFTACWHEKQKLAYSASLAITLGAIILIHPTGFFALLIPVLWNVHDKAGWKAKIQLVKANARQIDVILFCLFAVVLPPVLFMKFYPGEAPLLSFSLPGMFIGFSSWLWSDLFFFDHGWLIYSPLMILPFIGFYFFAGKNRPLFYAIFLVCILDLFLESSWTKLGTTPVFGQVAFIPVYALLSIPMAALFGVFQKPLKIPGIIFSLVLVFFIAINLFQTWQFQQDIIVRSGMKAEDYRLVFGRTHLSLVEKIRLERKEADTNQLFRDEKLFTKTMLAFYDFEKADVPYRNKLESVRVRSGKMAMVMDNTNAYSPGLNMGYDEFMRKPRVGMRITASVFAAGSADFSDVNLVVNSLHKGNNYRYSKVNLHDLNLKPGVWNTVSLIYLIPESPYPGDRIQSYVWYTGNSRIFIDDVKFEAFEPKK